jgi:aspartate aminotransferase-like enzyme
MRRVFADRRRRRDLSSSGTGAWEAAFVNTLSPGDGC